MNETPRVSSRPSGTDSSAASDDTPQGDGSSRLLDVSTLEQLVFNAEGLLPAIIQDAENNQVLMLAWMDLEALRRTLTEGRVTFWSRSRREYWRKGDTSGHVQYVQGAAVDCDGDTVLIRVIQIGAACHTGTRTCFDGHDFAVVQGSPEF